MEVEEEKESLLVLPRGVGINSVVHVHGSKLPDS
jgi:hypothetical protein